MSPINHRDSSKEVFNRPHPVDQASLAQMVMTLEGDEPYDSDDLAAIWKEEIQLSVIIDENRSLSLLEAIKSPEVCQGGLHQMLSYAESNIRNPKRLFPETIYQAMSTLIQFAMIPINQQNRISPQLEQNIRTYLKQQWLDSETREWMECQWNAIRQRERLNN